MQYVDPRDVERLARDGAAVLDARAAEHYARAHIPSAQSAPVDGQDFAKQVRRVAPSLGGPVVLYGRDEQDTDPVRAATEVEALGYRSVYVLRGGSTAWWKSGRTLEGDQVASHMDLSAPRTGGRDR